MSFEQPEGEVSSFTFTRTHLALPLGLIGFAGAAYVADYYRIPFARSGDEARGLLAFAIPLAGAIVGALLSSRWISRSLALTLVAAILATSVAGGVIGGVTASCLDRTSVQGSAAVGATTSFVFLPVIAFIGWLGRGVGRARLGSIVDGADRRAPWAATALCIACGRLPSIATTNVQLGSELRPSNVALALAGLSVVALLGMTLFDGIDLARSKLALGAVRDMSERNPADGLPCERTIDVGIGDEEYEELIGGPAYRSVARPLRVVRGSPLLAMRAMSRAFARSMVFTALGITGVALSFVRW